MTESIKLLISFELTKNKKQIDTDRKPFNSRLEETRSIQSEDGTGKETGRMDIETTC